MPIVEALEPCITCHAWNRDRSMLAISPNSNDIHIYSMQAATAGPPKFTRAWTLREHDALVTGIDWAASTNRIVSSSQDRNAYVWELQDNEWRPTLVILRLQRAATSVSWSPDEAKFAVGSGEKLVAVCYFESQNNFWVSKHLRRHGSTVLGVSWSPSALLLATGCADSRARIVSAYVKGVDKSGKQTPFGEDPAFGTVLAEYACAGWVHAAAWHPNGTTVVFASHDSRVTVVSLLSPEAPLQVIRLRGLPIKALSFLPTGSFIGVGFEYTPLLFRQTPGASTYSDGEPLETAERNTGGSFATSAVNAAMRMFQAQDKAGQEQTVSQTAKLSSVHQNCVTCVRAFEGKVGGRVVDFTTTGLDGFVVFWTSDELVSAMRAATTPLLSHS